MSRSALAWASICAFVLWLEPSLGQIDRYLGLWGGAIGVCAAGVGIAAALARLNRQPQASEPGWGPLFLIAMVGIILFVILFPIALSGVLGGGSDRADALNVTVRALLHGQPPYDVLTYRGNPPKILPGAMILALPFYLAGTAAFQNPVWLAIFVALSPFMVGDRRAAAVYLSVFLICCPGALQDFVTGGDYWINAIYVAVSVHLLLNAQNDRPRVLRLLACLLFALCVSSRPIYAVEAPIVTAYIWQRRGAAGLFEFLVATGAALTAINAPVLLAARYPVFWTLGKLAFFPASLHAEVLIPAISLGVACSAWFVPLSRRRVFLFSALSFIPMFVPALLYALLTRGPAPDVLIAANYSLPLTVFGSLWLLNLISATAARVSDVRIAAQAA